MKKYFFTILIICFSISFAYAEMSNKSKKNMSDRKIESADDWIELNTLSDVDEPPKVLKTIQPVYPYEAGMCQIDGEVVLSFTITKEGNVKNIIVKSSDPEGIFEKTAVRSYNQWKFKAAKKNGEMVDAQVITPLKFEYHGPSSWGEKRCYAYIQVSKGISRIMTKQYSEAVVLLTEAIENWGKYKDAYFYRGICFKELGEYSSAISDFGKAIKLNKRDFRPYYNRGNLYYLNKEFQKAVEDYSKAIKKYGYKEKPDIALSTIYTNRANAYRQMGNYKKAINDTEEIIKLDKSNKGIFFLRGNIFREIKQYNNAIENYSIYITQNPDNLTAYIFRGYCYEKVDDLDNTCSDFKMACELGDCRGIESLKKTNKCR